MMTIEGLSQASDDEISIRNSMIDDSDDKMMNADDDNHYGQWVVSSG
jgi:hypothetical protein